MNPDPSAAPIRVISSMATRALLVELAQAYTQAGGRSVDLVSVGGIEAARRVQAGERFDVVVLATDAIDGLMAGGRLRTDSRRALVESSVAVAVPAGTARPDIGSEDALRRAVLAADRIGYSTGPSGTALLRLFEHWGLSATLGARLVQAPPGVPVGSLIANGAVGLGFQQLSELQGLAGIAVLGSMPRGLEIVTTFVAAITADAQQAESAGALLDFMLDPAHDALKRRHGMEAPPAA